MVKDENNKLTHINAEGNPAMVDVSAKQVTKRTAWARCKVHVSDEIIGELNENEIHTKKGPVFQTAIIAGVMGAKQTSSLIPFCHPIGLEDCQIKITSQKNDIVIDCRTTVTGKTGVEMEAITGASVAALTVYDMCKALSHDMVIGEIQLMSKTGGKKDFNRANE